jgi:hypothetical protein
LSAFIPAFTGDASQGIAGHTRRGSTMGMSDDRVHAAVDRILRTWSLIKMVPEHQMSGLRSSLMDTLYPEAHLTEDELVVLGLKYLHRDEQGR